MVKVKSRKKESNVYSALLELATYTKLESNIYHKDVIDAMMRQPFFETTIPFKTNIIKPNTVINAVDYDLGRNGFAYNDTDTADYWVAGKKGVGNRGGIYRNDGVDIRKDSAMYESYYVSDIENGEWLQYTVDIVKKGNYTLAFEIANDKPGGNIAVLTGNNSLSKTIPVPATAGLNNWQTIEAKNIILNEGKQEIKVFFVNGGFNLKSIKFIKAGK